MQVRGTQRNSRKFKKLPLFMAVLGCLYGMPALAQEQQEQQEQTEESTEQPQAQQSDAEATELETITVTGSLLRRREYDSVSPVQIITADTNVALGQVNPAEFLQKSSVGAGETQISNQFSGFVVEGGTGVQTLSLRGLGAQRTLVLLDGQRPGPAGTRGQVGAFDLNVIPSSILQRIEIVKDGSSSIYGSDAVAGVVNLITRKRVDRPELNIMMRTPVESGGEVYTVDGATGWEFDKGTVVAAAEWYLMESLDAGDRDFLACSEDLVYDSEGGDRIDRQDRSIIAGTPLADCNNLYAYTVIDALRGTRYIPSPDGRTIGLMPGFRPRENRTYANGGQAYYEDVLNYDFIGTTQLIDRQERGSLYAATDFAFDKFNWRTQWLYNKRTTDTHRYRQFFPLVGGATAPAAYRYANDPTYRAPVPSGLAQPIMPFPSDQKVDVDYLYGMTRFDGQIGGTETWAWEAGASYSRSDGDYDTLSIVASRSGDVQFDDNAPELDYFSRRYLSGAGMDELVAQIGQWHKGNTIYDQGVVNAIATGELFNLPAGPVAAAFGLEYRRYSIDDQPSELSISGDLWGQSSAQRTKGDDNVREAFAEFEVPLLKGKPGFESLTLNASGRVFQYGSIDGSDSVWKAGLNWQIIPSLKLRATRGTSFRAPGLYELYLGDQTAFNSQLAIDPCIQWADPSNTNDFIRTNCAAAGIPGDYAGAASSAVIVSGGGAGVLNPETSKAFTTGIVFTPTFANFSIALDFFEMEVNDQIAQLGGGAIVAGCYGSPIYPNAFCDLFDRNPGTHPTDPYKIEEVRDSYININRQKVSGYDLQFNYDRDFAFGKVSLESNITYTKEDISELFDSAEESGFASSDFVGNIGRPEIVANFNASLKRNDWTYYWGVQYIDETENLNLDPEFTYNGRAAWRDIVAESRTYHTLSARYGTDDWSLLLGVQNVFDAKPPVVSTGVASRYGNIPAFATQYDYFGRTPYVRLHLKF